MAFPNEKLASLEALLFIHGEPLGFARIGKVLNLSPEEARGLVAEFKEKLKEESRGIALIQDGDKVQLITKPQFHHFLESFVKDQLSEDLTPASLETLAIIAYFGPISRSRVEYQRGVNSILILRNLLLRGLVERFPDPDRPQSYLYRASFDFWRHIGVPEQKELPDYEKFRSLLAQFEAQPPT